MQSLQAQVGKFQEENQRLSEMLKKHEEEKQGLLQAISVTLQGCTIHHIYIVIRF